MERQELKTAPQTFTEEALLADLNDEQRRAVSHDGGPLLIVAGAGTGKTTVITNRIAWLIATGRAKPEEILALTFTDKAAGEMTERVDRLLPLGYTDLWISTFHAFCQRLLQAHGLDIGLPDDFRLLNQTDAYLLLRKNFDRFALDYYRPLGNPTKFLTALLSLFSRAKDEAVHPREYLDFAKNLSLDKDNAALDADEKSRQSELAEAYHAYERLLLENSSIDLGDLMLYALELFSRRPAILEKYRKQFKYILVDEFQDTNWAQYELVKRVAPKHGNIVVVGDDDQSIYKFRGASVSNILQFKNDFPGAGEVVLTRNYRSLQNILDLSYGFIQRNNPNRLEA
ncbi:MAG: UvrD-helicase domain-containing protein, partial [Patescibacteria group bacterium]